MYISLDLIPKHYQRKSLHRLFISNFAIFSYKTSVTFNSGHESLGVTLYKQMCN